MLERIDNLIKRANSLKATDRETTFLDSIRKQWLIKGELSFGQMDWFKSLEMKYSEETLNQEKDWAKNYTQEHRTTARRVAHYYKANPPYFEKYVNWILNNPDDFILSKSQWTKFCENKYAKKILKEYEAEPKFTVGQAIKIRVNNKVRRANYNKAIGRVANKLGFVLDVGCKPITRAAKGSKIYQVLLAGDTSPIYCHESDLKNNRR